MDLINSLFPESKERQRARIDSLIHNKQYADLPDHVIAKLSNNILVTTEHNPSGLVITKRLGIVTSTVVYGFNIVREQFVSFRDFFGGRSRTTQKALKEAAYKALIELKREALYRKANGIIATHFSFTPSLGDKSMIFVIASGTAVTYEDEDLS